MHIPRPEPRVSDMVDLRWILRTDISNIFPGEADVMGPVAILQETLL